jgi:DNA-binding beta-propeller fold protein YncE
MTATPASPHDRVFLSVSLSLVFVLGVAGCAAILTSCGSGGGGGDSPAAPPPPDASVAVSPALATVAAGQEVQFTADVRTAGSTAVQWTLDGGAVDGTVSANGLYRAPAPGTLPASRIVTLRAVSAANPSRSGTASILLAATGRLPMLNGPTGVAIEPSGRSALVTEFESGEVSRVDLETGLVTTIAKGLLSPFGVLPEPSGFTALVSEWDAQQVTRIDLTRGTGTVIRTVPLSKPAGMTMVSGLVLLADEAVDGAAEGKMWRFSPATADNSVTVLASGVPLAGARGIAVLKDGFTALATAGNVFGKLVMVDINPGTLHAAPSEIVIGGNPLSRPVGIAKPSASTTTALLADEFLGKVFKVDFSDLNAVSIQELAASLRKPRGVALEPGENALLVAEAGSGNLSRLMLAGCTAPPCPITRVVSGLAKPLSIAVEAGERTALVVEQDTGEVSRVNLANGRVTTLAEGLHRPSGLAIESGGSTALVAGVRPRDQPSSIDKGIVERVHLDTGTHESLVETPDMTSPAAIVLLPGGTRALVTDPLAATLFVVDLQARTITPLATSPPFTQPNGLAVEPDGKTALVTDTAAGTLLRLTLPPCATITCPVTPVRSGLQSPIDVAIEPGGATALVLQQQNLIRLSIAGPQLSTPTTIVPVATGLNNPRRLVIEPGGRTALVTEATPDGIRRIKLK